VPFSLLATRWKETRGWGEPSTTAVVSAAGEVGLATRDVKDVEGLGWLPSMFPAGVKLTSLFCEVTGAGGVGEESRSEIDSIKRNDKMRKRG